MAATDFDPSDAIDFWDQVNREDWRVCELTQKGVRRRGYVAGPLLGRRGRRPRLRHDGRRALHEALERAGERRGDRVNPIAASSSARSGCPSRSRDARGARLGRGHRRRRPQRPHRRRLPGPGRASRCWCSSAASASAAPAPWSARSPTTASWSAPAPTCVGLLDELRDRRARPARARPALLGRRPEPLGPVRRRHLLRPVPRRRPDPGATSRRSASRRPTSTATGPTSSSSTRSPQAAAQGRARHLGGRHADARRDRGDARRRPGDDRPRLRGLDRRGARPTTSTTSGSRTRSSARA